ncbi:MAG TPA: glycoside hydrolase family 18 protein [Usitatibacter sp.]|nr:glycoside hydrolase family 18 protein [Usitatibacter sp.]
MTVRVALACVALCAASCASDSPQRAELIGYYAGWTEQGEIDSRRLSAIDYAFLALEADGSVALAHPGADEASLARLARMKRDNPALVLFASVGGWTGSSGFSDMASDASSRARFIASSLAFLRRYGFDGIDIDWEYPGAIGVACAPGLTCERPGDKENFVRLAREMRAAMDGAGRAEGRRYRLTIAAGADAKFAANSSGPWLARLAASLDWINLMTYDYHGTWERESNFVAPLRADPAGGSDASVDASVSLFLAEGVPPGKLVPGIAFYGKGWTGCAPGPRGDGLFQRCKDLARPDHEATFEFAYLEDEGFLARDGAGELTRAGRGFERHWSAAASGPWLYEAASGTFIAYDDERSVRDKAREALRRGLRGVMFWEVSADRHGVLLRAVADELGR